MASDIDSAQELLDQKKRSYSWMSSNYYGEWEQVFQAYKAERDPELDENGKPDKTQTSIALPATWASIRRTVARITAQIPDLHFIAKDPEIAQTVGRTLMYQWDKGGVQRFQKRHATQASMLGWSVRPWYWSKEVYNRSKRVDPLTPDPATTAQIAATYEIPEEILNDPQMGALARAELLAKYGRGGLLPVKYEYTGFLGPKCDFLFAGDCFPEPGFQTLQSSKYLIVERRRNRAWLEALAKQYEQFGKGIDQLLTQYPKGTDDMYGSRETQELRRRFMRVLGHVWPQDPTVGGTGEWTITERHCPGSNPRLAFLGEENVWIGEIPYPYDLDGKIAFTELVLIDDIMWGIGDSTARIIRGVQQLLDRGACVRMDLVYALLRPLIGTSNRELYENPDLIKRHKGLRLVMMRGPGDLWVQPEQAAMAAAAAGLQEEGAIMRHFQMATGESNASMMANVDPAQSRTATGARLMAYNQDVLTKDMVDMFTETGVRSDAEMMYLLNRSELADQVEFESSNYDRMYTSAENTLREQWIIAEPAHFQVDGEIVAKTGSTLADDDEAKVTKATNLFQAAMSRPDLFNQQKARDNFLIAMGEGRQLNEWAAQPAPPPPQEVKTSVSVSIKPEMMPVEVQQSILQKAGLIPSPPVPPQEQPPGPEMGAPPEGGGPPGAPPNGAPMPMTEMPAGPQSALGAARGRPGPIVV